MGKIEEEIKQKSFKNEFVKAHVNLMYTFHHFNNRVSKAIKVHKLTNQQYNVLRILRGSYPDFKRVGDVKAVMLDKNPDLTRLIDRLLAKKLVDRENCDQDRRQVNIKITEAGLKLLEIIDADMQKIEKKFESISEAEAKELNRILDKWRG
ncbi:MAG: MarR family transcriptional regulator [Crocinitomicaceae bacterium]